MEELRILQVYNNFLFQVLVFLFGSEFCMWTVLSYIEVYVGVFVLKLCWIQYKWKKVLENYSIN